MYVAINYAAIYKTIELHALCWRDAAAFLLFLESKVA